MQTIYLMVLFINNFKRMHAEYFTCVTELEQLMKFHERVLSELVYYVDFQDKKLTSLKRYLNLYQRENKEDLEAVASSLNSSLNAFILTNRLVTDLDNLLVMTTTGTKFISFLFLKRLNTPYPNEKDLIGAAQGVARLAKVYNLEIKDLADGNLNNIAYTTPMTASDCYELSQALVQANSKDFTTGRAWMLEAQRKFEKENVSYPFNEYNITKYLNMEDEISGDTKSADPSRRSLNVNETEEEEKRITKENFEQELKVLNTDFSDTIDKLLSGVEYNKILERKPQEILSEKSEEELKNYEEVCRGDLIVPTEISNRLNCRYLTENHPFLKIAPHKVEMMYLNPDVILFHDVLSDNEIEAFKQKATPVLARARINNPKTHELAYATYRIGKMAWVFDEDSEILARVTRRVGHMTGLITELTQHNQVVNYGIGGQYEPHYDFATKKEARYNPMFTNRIATVLFYMSNVAQGGATVFPELGVRLLPEKGAAAMWFNLHPSLEGNYAMRHAACPVLQGNKWVVSKFIDTEPQVFIKPCGLEYQEEGFNGEISQPVPKPSGH